MFFSLLIYPFCHPDILINVMKTFQLDMILPRNISRKPSFEVLKTGISQSLNIDQSTCCVLPLVLLGSSKYGAVNMFLAISSPLWTNAHPL